jgi:hypothetical protein
LSKEREEGYNKSMLKTLEKELVEQVEKNNPGCFFITSEDNDEDVLIIFKYPGKQELKKYRNDFEREGLGKASGEMLYSCLLAPEANLLKKELDDDYYLQTGVKILFARKILAPYQYFHIGDAPEVPEELKNRAFCIKNGDDVIGVFLKPGKLENKKFQRQLEQGSKRAGLDLMLDCVYPTEDRKRVAAMVQENKLLEDTLVANFSIKVAEHVKIRG